MNKQDLVLNIAVNMGRLCRFSLEGRESRIKQFINDSEIYLEELEKADISDKFKPTLENFKREFGFFKSNPINKEWSERALTWANILQHRAKLA